MTWKGRCNEGPGGPTSLCHLHWLSALFLGRMGLWETPCVLGKEGAPAKALAVPTLPPAPPELRGGGGAKLVAVLVHKPAVKAVTRGPHLHPALHPAAVPRHPPPESFSPPPRPPRFPPGAFQKAAPLSANARLPPRPQAPPRPPSAARAVPPQNGRHSLTAPSQSRGRAPRSCTAAGPGRARQPPPRSR